MFKYAIALTGSIATGKSTVSKFLKSKGFEIIDADIIANKILDEKYKWIRNVFGDSFVKDKTVDRKLLGQLIFSDKAKKKELEAFIHPLIKQQIEYESSQLDKLEKIYFVDIPLFFESQNSFCIDPYCIKNIAVVYTPESLQLKRLMKRNNMTESEALARIASQISIENKKSMATWVIDNSYDENHLNDECEKFLLKIEKSTF